MKNIFFICISLLLLHCHSKTESEEMENEYPRKYRFIVSENDRRLDSVKSGNEKKGIYTIKLIEGFDSIHSTGGVHFLIEDNKDVYFFSSHIQIHHLKFVGQIISVKKILFAKLNLKKSI